MISTLFFSFLKISALSGFGILLILIVSPVLGKKYTVFWRYALWIVLAVRLILPFDISLPGRAVVIPVPDGWRMQTDSSTEPLSGHSLKPSVSNPKTLSENTAWTKKDTLTGTPANFENNAPQANASVPNGKTPSQTRPLLWYAAVCWLTVAAVMLLWQLACYGRFRRKLEQSKHLFSSLPSNKKFGKKTLPVYVSAHVASPMLVGIWNPQIFLPDKKSMQLAFILEHEITHYRRKDLWVKLLLAIARTIHWFNPLVAVMERQAWKDIELLCDSSVVKNFSREKKKQYGETLLACADLGNKRHAIFCTSEFSKDADNLKERISGIFSDKRKSIFAAGFGILALLSVSLFLSFGASGKDSPEKSVAENPKKETRTDAPKSSADDARLKELLAKFSGITAEEAAAFKYGAAFPAYPKPVFASEQRAVFYDYWGLCIYDVQNRRIEQILDLKAAELCFIQGDTVTHIEASKDGKRLLLYNEPNTTERFVYHIDEKRLEYAEFAAFEDSFDSIFENSDGTYYAMTEAGKRAWLSYNSLVAKDGATFHYVEQTSDDGQTFHEGELCGLSLNIADNTIDDVEVYPLFAEVYEKQGETAATRLWDADFRTVVGKELLHQDADGWSYYLEQDIKKESRLWEMAPGMEPLLLTRQKDGKRQILEDLICKYTWQMSPVLFAKGRIVYKAAPTADIIGMKEPVLVSIAMDGSDRKIADTILYHTVNGLCEDGGWIYYAGWAEGFPKPLCRISPDFSSGPLFVQQLPGLLCGVKDDFAYYMASDEKTNLGIWKRNLATGEEQVYDKWGEPAENFIYFNAREMELPIGENGENVPACRLLFSYNYNDGVYTGSVRLD